MSLRCNFCNEDVLPHRFLIHSRTKRHKLLCTQEKDSDYAVYIINSAFKCRIISYRINGSKTILDPKVYMFKIAKKLENVLKVELEIHTNIKVNVELFCTFVKTNSEDGVVRDLKSFNTKNVCLNGGVVDFPTYFENVTSIILKKCEEFQERDSGWALEKIEFFEININKYHPLQASSYIPLPTKVQLKKACVNVKNTDNACFFWAVISALYPADQHCYRVSSYPHYSDVFNIKDIKCPVSFKDIKRFERLNNISVNIYGLEDWEECVVQPLYISKVYTKNSQDGSENTMRHVNLLYLEKGLCKHYVWIKNLSRLVSAQLSKCNGRVLLCDGCLQVFSNEKKLNLHHTIGCGEKLIHLPTEDNKFIKFSHASHKMKVPFVIYADFESILIPISRDKSDSHSTFHTHQHVPCCFAYYIHCEYNQKLSKFVIYRGKDCVQKFIENLYQDADNIVKIVCSTVPPKHETPPPESTYCHICEQSIELNQDYVIDHCHLTGKIRGRAHKSCNLNYKLPRFIPVIFHNLSGYDSHLFIKELAKSEGKLDCIPHNKEKYISFSKEINNKMSLRFIDSFKFMSSSLEKLVKNLSKDQFKILPDFIQSLSPSSCCGEQQERLMNLLTRKGVYPYEYVNDWSKLEETALPNQDEFYSKLTDLHVSEEDYQHAQNVWKTFEIKSLGEYCDLYLKTDVLLLAEVFENFRQICMTTYELDPCQYVTAPGLSWDAMLKYTNIHLELFTDYEMIQFIKLGIRGGISQVSKRHAIANNRFMKNYDSNRASNYIVYLDINNLYGDAMRRPLPIGNFRWLNESEIKNFDVRKLEPTSNRGYILEVDLEYPQHLHDSHNNYPFCAETKTPPGGKVKKLLLTFENKNNYVIHYCNLKQCLEKGLILKKIHRILEFNQSPWLKIYIDLNSHMRAQAKNSFEKDFFKLMNNAIFGKTIENVEKRVDVQLCCQWDCLKTCTKPKYGLERYISKPNFHSATIFSEDLVAVQLNKSKIVYDKPIYVGFVVLELSKNLMYDFHYDYMMPKYGENMSLLYTDTDSFIYNVYTDNFYEDIKQDLETKFDTSDFPIDNVYGLPLVNKKVVGVMKDENSGRIMREYRSKVQNVCLHIRRR